MAMNDRISSLMGGPDTGTGADNSRATSPGGDWRGANGTLNGEDSRSRPRTFPYFEYLPYQTEDHSERLDSLNTCLKHLYIAVSAGDFAPGAVHWTREIPPAFPLVTRIMRSGLAAAGGSVDTVYRGRVPALTRSDARIRP